MASRKIKVLETLLLVAVLGLMLVQFGAAHGHDHEHDHNDYHNDNNNDNDDDGDRNGDDKPEPATPPPPPNLPGLPGLPNLPGLPGLPTLPGVVPRECMLSFNDLTRCLSGGGLLPNLQIGKTFGSCCRAIAEVHEDCWPKIFPWDALLPHLLRSYCSIVEGALPGGK